jgi:hypothetical protein
MKVSELTGALLDYWVARAEGWVFDQDDDMWRTADGRAQQLKGHWTPSTYWAQGGPIIERERMSLDGETRHAAIRVGNGAQWQSAYGETLLVAAMRAYVASRFGDDVADHGIPS